VRYDFVTEGGKRLGVISHFSGRRQLLVYDREDPDACREVVELEPDDVRTFADVLGASHVTEHLASVQQSVRGVTIDWLPLDDTSPFAGRTLGDTALRSRTGVSVVAVVRDGDTFPSPAPDFQLEPGDTAVVVGTPEGIRNASAILRDG
jgi:TrkA domain protein